MTPHCSTGQSPSDAMYGRKIKTRLDMIIPDKKNKFENSYNRKEIESKHLQRKYYRGRIARKLKLGKNVQIKNIKGNKSIWLEAKIKEIIGKRLYLCELQDGKIIKRHIDQIK